MLNLFRGTFWNRERVRPEKIPQERPDREERDSHLQRGRAQARSCGQRRGGAGHGELAGPPTSQEAQLLTVHTLPSRAFRSAVHWLGTSAELTGCPKRRAQGQGRRAPQRSSASAPGSQSQLTGPQPISGRRGPGAAPLAESWWQQPITDRDRDSSSQSETGRGLGMPPGVSAYFLRVPGLPGVCQD